MSLFSRIIMACVQFLFHLCTVLIPSNFLIPMVCHDLFSSTLLLGGLILLKAEIWTPHFFSNVRRIVFYFHVREHNLLQSVKELFIIDIKKVNPIIYFWNVINFYPQCCDDVKWIKRRWHLSSQAYNWQKKQKYQQTSLVLMPNFNFSLLELSPCIKKLVR